MSKRYIIWDKKTDVLTPIGEVLKPEQWIAKRPIANIVKTVVSGGTINGAFFGVYDEMVDYYTKQGCDFSNCTTEQEHLDAIEQFEDDLNKTPTNEITTEERTASALEALVLMNMPDETVTE